MKQAGREWYKELYTLFTEVGFTCSSHDHAVFFKKEGNNIFIVAVHVDDLTLVTNSETVMKSLKGQLGSRFELVDLGPIH